MKTFEHYCQVLKGNNLFYDRFYKKVGASFSKRVISDNCFTYFSELRILKNLLVLHKRPSFLDIGCGVGSVSLWLANKGFKVTGIDVSKVAIELCQRSAKELGLEHKAKFIVCNFPKEILNDRFDFVIISEVIEHIKNDQLAIRSIFSLLKDKGQIFVSVPSKNAPLFKLGFAKKFDDSAGHLRRYSKEEISNLLTNNGFEITKIKKKEGILRNTLFLSPMFTKLIRFIKGPFVYFVSFWDDLTIPLFGESDLMIVARKIRKSKRKK